MIESMINEIHSKRYCSEDISLIENYHMAIADKERKWEIHHRRECDEEGITLFTGKQLIEMNLYYKRPAKELIFVTRSMHNKIHRERSVKGGKISGKILNEKLTFKQRSKGGKKHSIRILQFSKSGEFIKEWQSATEAGRQLGIPITSIGACLRYGSKTAGGFVWRYKDPR